MSYAYPLKINFKLIALAPRISVKDANNTEILYVEQKVLALKEAVKVYDNEKDKNILYTMQANQIIDFGAKYIFRDSKTDKEIGSIQQEGVRSLFQASYTVFDKRDIPSYQIKQTNPLIAVLDSLISIIPFAELLTGFFLNPTYTASRKDDATPLLTMKKNPSFFESNFTLEKTDQGNDNNALLLLLACLMIVQLERNRG